MVDEQQTLDYHVKQVLEGNRSFENVFQSVIRMILEKDYEKVNVNGNPTYDYQIFREGKKHIIGMYDEINKFVGYVKNAAEGGSAKEMGFVLIGEPGNGKTFFVEQVCDLYRNFLSHPENQKYTFVIENPNAFGEYGQIKEIESQTYEDPMRLIMNLSKNREENLQHLKSIGFDDQGIKKLFENHRPLGACSTYILNQLRKHCKGDIEKMKEFIRIENIDIDETSGTVTGKYPSGDKITSSATDLTGKQSLPRLLNIPEGSNPYTFDLRIGALARVAGGGIHFADEILKNKRDLVKIYLGVINDRLIEVRGYKWPIDTLIIATSNNEEYNRFASEKEESPILNRLRRCFVAHNTNYKLQKTLTSYSLGDKKKTTFSGEELHIDPNLIQALSYATTLTRIPRSERLPPIEFMKLSANEEAGEKSIKLLKEIVDEKNRNPKVNERFGQKGVGHRDLGIALQTQMEMSTTNEGCCMFTEDAFIALESIIYDVIQDPKDREKFFSDIKLAKGLYRDLVEVSMFNAYMQKPDAIKDDVLRYVNMVIGIDATNLGADKMWGYTDPQTKERVPLQIDERFMKAVESRMGLSNSEHVESFRGSIRRLYGQRIPVEPNYDFMDNHILVKAVTNVRLKSDFAEAGSLIGILSNPHNEKNREMRSKVLDAMTKDGGYCNTCAQKTIDYYCRPEDES